MQSKVSTKHATGEKQESLFMALEAFANMGDTPEDWQQFHTEHPDFFPTTSTGWDKRGEKSFTDWLYGSAEGAAMTDLSPAQKFLCNPLLWYRDRVGTVWARNDPYGAHLCVLLGFEREARELAKLHPDINAETPSRAFFRGIKPINPAEEDSFGSLPRGRPVVDGIRGEISWEFRCDFQQAVYELMRQRWRAKVCPECGKYFIAVKTAQVFCTSSCSAEMKRKRALDYWNREGSAKRDERTRMKVKSKRGRK